MVSSVASRRPQRERAALQVFEFVCSGALRSFFFPERVDDDWVHGAPPSVR